MNIKNRIENLLTFEYLKNIPEHQVFLYLKEKAEDKYLDESGYDYISIENLLATLNRPLINLGLTQFGYDKDCIKQLYLNGNKTLKLAALSNRKNNFHNTDTSNQSWVDESIIKAIISSDDEEEKYSLLTNPLIGSSLLEKLFEKKEPFKLINDEVWRSLVEYSSENVLLQKPYDRHYLDGFTEYTYACMFRSAWKLAEKVPVNKEWASTLEKLLSKVYPEFDIDLLFLIERWRSLGTEDSLYIRGVLAKRLPGKDFIKLKDSEELGIRQVYYENFGCLDEKQLDIFFQKDKNDFLNYAIGNDNLYRDGNIRNKLGEIAYNVEDGDLTYYNWFISASERNKRKNPEWFEENESSDLLNDVENDSDPKFYETFKKLDKVQNLTYIIFLITASIAAYLFFK